MQQLNDLIKHPENLGEETLNSLRSLLVRYPYFQTAWLLYLKNLYLLNHPSFKDELRRGALYVADLSVLFYYIEGNRFVIDTYVSSRDEDSVDNGDRTLTLIDRFLSGLSDKETLSSELPLPVEQSSDYTSVLLEEPLSDSAEELCPMRGQSLIDSFIEKSESVSSDNLLEEIRENSQEGVEEVHNAEEKNLSNENNTSPVSDNTEDRDDEYLTETLAKIYVKQQRYDKALEIIKKLYLKYPKKNAYFADQIRFLEKLNINAKSK